MSPLDQEVIMSKGIIGLAEVIHEATGEEGPELDALTFLVSAWYADALGRRDIGDYFDKRCKEATAKSRFAPN